MRIFGLALLSALVFMVAGCGGDDDDKGDNGGSDNAAAETTEEDGGGEAEEEEAPAEEGGITEETLTVFIEAINEDPSVLCDPENVTAELLEGLGGEEECLAAAEEQPAGEPYEIDDITIDGESATATITDDDSTNEVTFVVEGDEIKVSASEEVE